MGKTPYLKEKRPDVLPEWKQQDLMFDLINAFVLAKDSKAVALLLRDLFTTKEVRNLAKRLQIAKMLLAGEKYSDITDYLNCSLGTVSKVKIWLETGGYGLQQIILRLPQRTKRPGRPSGIFPYNLPQVLLAGKRELRFRSEEKRLNEFLDRTAEKGILDKNIREQLAEEFRIRRPPKVKTSK